MSEEIHNRSNKRPRMRRTTYADKWVKDVTPDEILNSYTKCKGEYLLIWINKTAGVAITQALGIDKDAYSHYTATELRDILGRHRYDNMFKFCFVRNPWDKVVSEFCFRVWTWQNELTADSSFSEWVRSTYVDNDPKYFDWPKMFLPQMEWLTDEDGKLIVDFIGRFENLQNDFDLVCDNLGVARQRLSHANKSRDNGHYRGYYDADTYRIVADWFRADIEHFGYEF